MAKTYVIWWHSKFVDEINRDAPTIAAIVEKTRETLKHLEQLQRLEEKGKISIQLTGSLNPIYIQLIDPKVEFEVVKNPLIESIDQ